MPRILIVYGTTYGQTARLAGRLASGLRDAGCTVDIHRGDRLPAGVGVESYDGVVVAASVLMGHHQRYIRDFIRRSTARLNGLPGVLVSVCGAALDDPSQAQAYVDALLAESGWRPTVTRSFAGALAYTRYSWPVRWVLKRISRRLGRPTDTSRDWDFTDWDEVDRFARELPAICFSRVRAHAEPVARG
jgi:menaquinone-dependent protoporphyrinogen oxidase